MRGPPGPQLARRGEAREAEQDGDAPGTCLEEAIQALWAQGLADPDGAGEPWLELKRGTSELKLVAEVQGHHSARLDEITKALEPLARLDNFVRSVAHDHESRIQALEKRTGVRT